MKISGTRSIITFDYENGYVLKAKGELLTNGSFTAYRSSIQNWEPPYNHIPVSYTHLDVYKRQVVVSMKTTGRYSGWISFFILQYFLSAMVSFRAIDCY